MSAYDIVAEFEQAIADYAGSKYAVAVDSCTNALFLSCKYVNGTVYTIPARTYPGVASAIIHAGATIRFSNKPWTGTYRLSPYWIIDSALRFRKGMFEDCRAVEDGLYCLSFHSKKHLPLGRGGMILTNWEQAAKWLRKARFDGRDACSLREQDPKRLTLGWNCYMTPEQAARGLTLFELIKDEEFEDLPLKEQGYPDLSKVKAYQL